MIELLLMNLVVAASAFLLAYKIFQFSNFIDSLLALFIFYFTQIVMSELFLGISGLLFLDYLILLNLCILLIVWLLAQKKPHAQVPFKLNNNLKVFLSNKVVLFSLAVILGFALRKIFINLLNPPFGWDDLNYHFTFPVEWLKHGNFDTPPTVFDEPGPSYYPINGSLFFLWLMLPLKSVFLADLGQLPFFTLAFLAVYNIARRLQINQKLSFFAASLFLLIPNFFKQISIAYVDVMVAALFLVCLNYLFLLNKDFCGKNVLIYSASLGLLLGTKTLGLPYSILLFIPFLFMSFKNYRRLHLLFIFILFVVTLGGFSYIRNFLQTNNPLYPLDFKLFGKTVFKGVMDASTFRAHFKAEDYNLGKLLFHEGLGAQTLIFVLPAVFLGLPMTLIKRRKEADFNLIYFLALPVLIFLAYRFIIPLANTRYLYSLLGVGIISGFYIVQTLPIPPLIPKILVALCILASMFELSKGKDLGISIVLACLIFFSLAPLIKYLQGKNWLKKPTFYLSLMAVAIVVLIALEKNYVKNEFPRYVKAVKYSGFWPEACQAWDWLNNHTASGNIAYVGRPVPFPLYGANFKNNVYYVSVNKIDPVKLHYFPQGRYLWGYDFESLHKNLQEKGNYRQEADYAVWLNNLIRRNTSYLFVYSLHQTKEVTFPIEDNWAKSHPQRFFLSFNNPTIRIYKILR